MRSVSILMTSAAVALTATLAAPPATAEPAADPHVQTQEGRAVPGPVLGATYMLKNVEHGSCWQLSNPKATTYTLGTCDKNNKLQQFIYRHNKHLENVHTNKCVDNDNELGHRLYQWKNGCTAGNKYQTWNLIGDDNTNYRYILYSGATLANKVPRATEEWEIVLGQYHPSSDNAQWWDWIKVS